MSVQTLVCAQKWIGSSIRKWRLDSNPAEEIVLHCEQEAVEEQEEGATETSLVMRASTTTTTPHCRRKHRNSILSEG